jgi:cell division protein FtsZ
MIELDNTNEEITRIAVVGVGGAGCNAIKNLINFGIDDVDLIAINTDAKQLRENPAPVKLPIGKSKTRGQGAGSNPEIGKQAAEEDYQAIIDALKNKDMVFITAGMGGGTGTGAAPIVAKAAKENGSLVVAIVVTPLANEGSERWENAYKGLENLRKNVDGLIIVSNDKLSKISREQNLSVRKAFEQADKVVYDATKGIIDLINSVGIINVDFADVKTVILDKGDALIGKGIGEGDQRAIMAVESALNSPLLEGIDLRNAQSALVNITFGDDFYHYEVDQILNKIREATNPNLNIIHGLVEDSSMGSSVSVTVVVTGFTNSFLQEYFESKKGKDGKNGRFKNEVEEFVSLPTSTKKREPQETLMNYKATPTVVPEINRNDLTIPAYLRRNFSNGKEEEIITEERDAVKKPYYIDINTKIEEEDNFRETRFISKDDNPTAIRKLLD